MKVFIKNRLYFETHNIPYMMTLSSVEVKNAKSPSKMPGKQNSEVHDKHKVPSASHVKEKAIRERYYRKLGIMKATSSVTISALVILFVVFASASATNNVCTMKDDIVHEWSLPGATKDAWLDALQNSNIHDYKKEGSEALESLIDISSKTVQDILAGDEATHVKTALADLGSKAQAFLVRNLPMDSNVPSTPVDGARSLTKPTLVAEAVSIGLASLARGNLVSYLSEVQYSDPYFHEGFALKEGGTALNHNGTLRWHIDMSYMPLSLAPDLLMLYCIREGNDKHVKTMLIRAIDILEMVPHSALQVLREDRFLHKQPDWIHTWSPKPKPMVVGSPSNPTIFASAAGNASAFDPNDVEAKAALETLYMAIKRAEDCGLAAEVHLKEGDVLLFDQKHLLHTRKAFSAPLFDGNDRVLIRS